MGKSGDREKSYGGQSGKKPLSFRVAAALLLTWLRIVAKQRWHNTPALDRSLRQAQDDAKGVIVVANHVTDLDPLLIANLLYHHGVMPRFLAKASLFKIPILGTLMKSMKQIPVERGTKHAATALTAAQKILVSGDTVIIYPEGTHTRDPEGWPMQGRPGAVKLALETGALLIPMAHYSFRKKPASGDSRKFWPLRKTVDVVVGDPIDLSCYQGKGLLNDVLYPATDMVMGEITRLQALLRPGETPPERPWGHNGQAGS